MGLAASLRLVGVCGRALRKKTSLFVIIIICFSFFLLHIAGHTHPQNRRRERDDGESRGMEEDVIITPEIIEEVLRSLNESVSKVEEHCGKMVQMGGGITCECGKKKCSVDGTKFVCLDPDVRPLPGRCLALNFGIGFDLSFDAAMASYGCRVVAFDPTNANMTNRVYQSTVIHSVGEFRSKIRPLIPGRTLPYTLAQSHSRTHHAREFHALDAGLSNKDYTQLLNITVDSAHYSANIAAFLKYKTILDFLDHPRVDILKLDIEGNEWKVFEEILSSPDAHELLRPVRQILLETHFEFLNAHSDIDDILNGTWRTIRILQRLRDFGYTIAAYVLNETGQKHFVFQNINIPVYRELTLIKKGNLRSLQQ